MLEDSEDIEGVHPIQEANSNLVVADDSLIMNPTTNVNGLTASTTQVEEVEVNGLGLSNEVSEERIFDDVKQNINTVYFVLKEDLELLASKRDKFMLMSQKINDVHFSEVIKLNVGGHIFQTSLQNMRKYPESTLAAMFSENFDLVKGDDGAYFIDRDETLFRHILNFLRSGNGPSDRVVEASAEDLIREAEFFGLGRLVQIIKKEPNKGIIKGDENQSKANEPQSPDRNDLESKINEHCEQTQAIIDEIKLKLERGHSTLQKSFENLQEQKKEYLEMMKKVETVHFPEVVKLNVGGQIFETNVKTLQKDPDSLLASMFSRQIEVIKQENETYFIDRSGTLFGHVLDYLRTGKIPQKIIEDLREELLEEAIFYNIEGMVEAITMSNKRVKINVGGTTFETTAETLNKYPCSRLAQMLGKGNKIVFIDRNGTLFEHVLNYLRTGKIPQKIIQDLGEELLEEASFYNIKGMADAITTSSKAVKINVGGSTFETTTETLNKYPCSRLAQMLGKGNKTYFIDHDSTHFQHVLNYLRTGNLPRKIIQDFGEELLEEALFYNIKGMVNCVKGVVKINVDGSTFEVSVDTLTKYPDSRLAQMLHKEVDGIDDFNGTYYIKHSSKHFGDLLKAMEIEDISDKDLPSIVTSKVLNEAWFYEVNFYEKYASGSLFLSNILQNHKSHQKQLLEWLNKEDQPNSMQLIYSADLDGWGAKDLHKNCDGISPTLVLMESTHGNIFGGYTTRPWSSNEVEVMDKDLFLFKLAVKPTETSFKEHLDNGYIACCKFRGNGGPSFRFGVGFFLGLVMYGSGGLLIYDKPNENMCSWEDEVFLLAKMEVFQIK